MGFQQAVRDAVGRAACNLVGPGIPGSLYDFTSIGLVFPEQLAAFREWVCDGVDEEQGELQPGTPGFPGGQCPVQYNISVVYQRFPTSGPAVTATASRQMPGPIGGVTVLVPDPANQFGGLYLYALGPGGVEYSLVRIGGSFSRAEILSTTVSRVDGQPDNCGDKPPVPPTWNDEIPDDDPTQPPRPIVIAPRFPIVLPGGGLSFPFTVNGPNFNFDTTLRIGGGGGGGGGGDCDPIQPIFGPRNRTEPIGSENIPEVGENEPPEPPEGMESGDIVGCFVTVTGRQDATATVIGGVAGFPELLIPRIADISFAVTIDGKQAWTADIPVKFDKQWVPVPGRLLAYDVRIKPEPGVNALFFPLRVTEAFKLEAGLL